MPYATQYQASIEEEYRRKVVVATLLVARDVFVEADTTTNHANRLVFAQRVLLDPEGWSRIIGVVLAAVFDATNATADATLKTNVGQAWNFFADAVAAGAV